MEDFKTPPSEKEISNVSGTDPHFKTAMKAMALHHPHPAGMAMKSEHQLPD